MNQKPSAPIAAHTEVTRAAYIAWMLRIDVRHVFNIEPDCSPEGNAHLIEQVETELASQTTQADQSRDRSPRALWTLRTLQHCCEIRDGKADPTFIDPSNPAAGFDNPGGYRRGTYVFQEPTHDDD
jgi:hypothetical protein